MTGTHLGPSLQGPAAPSPPPAPLPGTLPGIHPGEKAVYIAGGKVVGFIKKNIRGLLTVRDSPCLQPLQSQECLGKQVDMQSEVPPVPPALCACASPAAMARVQPGWAHGHPDASEIPTPASGEHQRNSHGTWASSASRAAHGS